MTGPGSVKSISDTYTAGYDKGILCIGEVLPPREKNGRIFAQSHKHFESVFARCNEPKVKCVNLEQAVNDLNLILKTYNDNTINPNSKVEMFYPGRTYDNLEIGTETPIWYKTYELEVNRKNITYVWLSVASIGRSVYSRSMDELLNQKKPCRNRNNVCKACALFGMVGSDKEESALGSKIRITDGKYVKGTLMKKKVLRELSSPKSSYLMFYANTSDNKLGYDAQGATIRGRKFYWHNTKQDAHLAPLNGGSFEKTERNSTMDLLKDAVFDFDVYFDQINEEQYRELIWTLTLGENKADGKKCYKIGHGKPIGLGSCKIIITSVEQRKFDGTYQMDKTEGDDIVIPETLDAFDSNIVKQVLTISDLEYLKDMDVNYPNVVDENGNFFTDGARNNTHAAHKWFSNNNPLGSKSSGIKLPAILETKEKPLKYHVVSYPNNSGRNGNNRGNANRNARDNRNNNRNTRPVNPGDTQTGTIKFFNEDKNFGFIRRQGEGDVHVSGYNCDPNEIHLLKSGTRVQFTVGKGNNGKDEALNCRIIR